MLQVLLEEVHEAGVMQRQQKEEEMTMAAGLVEMNRDKTRHSVQETALHAKRLSRGGASGSSVKKMGKRKVAKRDKRKAAKISKRKAAKRDKRKAAKRGKMEERKGGGKMMMGMRSRLAGERLLGHSLKKMFGRGMKMRKE